MKVLVACEESQAVCKAFRERGHEAYSCDIQECSGGHPEWHIKGNVLQIINPYCVEMSGPYSNKYRFGIDFITQDGKYHVIYGQWDLIIAHPPCTYLSNAGARWLWKGHKLNKARYKKGLEAKDFFMYFWNAKCENVVIENPTPSAIYGLPKCTQIIQPYEYGHPYSKRTCLWIRGQAVKPLEPTNIVKEHVPYVTSGSYSKSHEAQYKGASRKGGSAKMRSKTFAGIAKAMAEQWSDI